MTAVGFPRERAHQQVLTVGGLARPLLALQKREHKDLAIRQRNDIRLVHAPVDAIEPDDVPSDLEPRHLDKSIARHHEALEIAAAHDKECPERLSHGAKGVAAIEMSD